MTQILSFTIYKENSATLVRGLFDADGTPKEFTQSQKLKDIIQQSCKNSSRVIAEVNGEIIKGPHWGEILIKEGDTIELVSFVGGG